MVCKIGDGGNPIEDRERKGMERDSQKEVNRVGILGLQMLGR